MKNKILPIVCLITFWFSATAFVPMTNDAQMKENSLFKIARSSDANEIYYVLKFGKNGLPDSVNPIEIFWYKPKNQNKKEELTFIQKKYAYGLKFLCKDKNEIKFQFVSYNKRSFTLKRNKGGTFRVFTFSQNRETEVQRIYIHLSGGSFWFPKISKIILQGTDAVNGKSSSESIIP